MKIEDIKKSTLTIAFCGKAGSGKTTAAHYLEDKYNFSVRSFAAPIKQALIAMLGSDIAECLYDHNQKNKLINSVIFPKDTCSPISPRRLMQTLGTEWGRNMIHPELWTNIMLKSLKMTHEIQQLNHPEKPNLIAVDDLRFLDEANMLDKTGAAIVLIKRPQQSATQEHDKHESERSINAIRPHYTIENDGDIKNLQRDIDELVEIELSIHQKASRRAL